MKRHVITLIVLCLLLAACSGGESTLATGPEQEAEEPVPVLEDEPVVTQITVDGKADDWAGREIVIDDPAGDGEEGYLDMTTTYAFQNRDALYFLIETPDPTLPLVQFDFEFTSGSRRFLISWSPGNPRGFRSELTSGFEEIGESQYSSYALADALEVRIDLRDFDSPERLELVEVRVMVGQCCNPPDWREADKLNPAGTPIVNEVDAAAVMAAVEEPDPEAVQFEGEVPMSRPSLAEWFQLQPGYNIEILFAPPAPDLTDIVRSESGIFYLHHGPPNAGISVFDPETAEVTRILDLPPRGAEFSAGGPGDTVYVWNSGHIMQVSPDGSYEVWGQSHMGHIGTVAPDGRLIGVYQDYSGIYEMQPNNESIEIAAGFERIWDVIVADDGTIYVSDLGPGSVVRVEGILHLDPMDIGFGPDGSLYLNSVVTGFVRLDTETGEMTEIPGSQSDCAVHQADFVFDDSGRVIFVDPTWSVITRLDMETTENTTLVTNMGVNTWALDAGPDDAIYVGTWSCGTEYPAQIVKYTDDRSREVVIDDVAGYFNDVALTPDGGMYVSVDDPGVGAYTAYIAPGSDTLARIDGVGGLISLTYDPVSGHAFGTYHAGDKLIEFSQAGKIAEYPISLPKAANNFVVRAAPDGTLYVYADEAERATSGPQVDRWVLRVDPAAGTSEIVYSRTWEGCCVMSNIDAGPLGYLYWLVSPEFEIHRITPEGEATVMARNLPVDPGAVTADSEGDIYFVCAGGIYRIYQE
jgi:streptogramin lyase